MIDAQMFGDDVLTAPTQMIPVAKGQAIATFEEIRTNLKNTLEGDIEVGGFCSFMPLGESAVHPSEQVDHR